MTKIGAFLDTASRFLIDPSHHSHAHPRLTWAATIILGLCTFGIAQLASAGWRHYNSPDVINETHTQISELFQKTFHPEPEDLTKGASKNSSTDSTNSKAQDKAKGSTAPKTSPPPKPSQTSTSKGGFLSFFTGNKSNALPENAHTLLQKASSLENDDDETLLKFASQTLHNIPVEKLRLTRSTPGLTTGVSGAPAILIFDDINRLLCVIKIKSEESLTPEIDALLIIKKLELKDCTCPKVMNVGKTPNGNVILVQSPAGGLPVEKYMEKLGNCAEEAGRKKELEELKKIMGTIAQGAASLHKSTGVQKSNDPSISQKRKQVIENYVTQLRFFTAGFREILTLGKETIEGLTLEKIRKLEDLVDENLFDKTTGSYVHGDFHPGNIFFNANGHPPITVIDTDMFMNSVDQETKAPMGRSAYDFVYYKLWLAVAGSHNGLRPEEIAALQKSFENAYLGQMGNSQPKLNEEIQFMNGLVCAKYISGLKEALKDPENPWLQALGEDKIRQLIAFLVGQIG